MCSEKQLRESLFHIDGRGYKGDPSSQADRTVNARRLDGHVRGAPTSSCLSPSFATIQDLVEPRSLNRFNQLNSVKISGIPMAPLDTALKVLEEEVRKNSASGLRYRPAGANRVNCVRRE